MFSRFSLSLLSLNRPIYSSFSCDYHFWLRHETKKNEHRTPLLPSQVKDYLNKGHSITVEKSPTRCYPDSDYEAAGCELVETETWPDAPKDAIILGLKELPEARTPLEHKHIYFAHCYKEQDGWEDILMRFKQGGGTIYDMEFLTFNNGQRVAAFGKSAGYAGMAVGVQAWAHKLSNKYLGKLNPKSTFLDLAKHSANVVKQQIGESLPRIVVIGGSGRCGTGAIEAALDIGIPEDYIESWDTSNTKNGGPFPELLNYDILVNCIYLRDTLTKPFLNYYTIKGSADQKKLEVLVDVSCDYNNPNNPLPIYNTNTTFDKPVLKTKADIDVVSIDHLPTLVPTSSSEEFAEALLPHLLDFNKTEVWERAENLYKEFINKV